MATPATQTLMLSLEGTTLKERYHAAVFAARSGRVELNPLMLSYIVWPDIFPFPDSFLR